VEDTTGGSVAAASAAVSGVGGGVVAAGAADVGIGAATVATGASATVVAAGATGGAIVVRAIEVVRAVVAGSVTVTMTCFVGAVVRPATNPPAIPASTRGTTHEARRDGAAGVRRSDTVMS
jgi:hypothetical protein